MNRHLLRHAAMQHHGRVRHTLARQRQLVGAHVDTDQGDTPSEALMAQRRQNTAAAGQVQHGSMFGGIHDLGQPFIAVATACVATARGAGLRETRVLPVHLEQMLAQLGTAGSLTPLQALRPGRIDIDDLLHSLEIL